MRYAIWQARPTANASPDEARERRRLRVLCVDDNEDVIDALRLLLAREPGFEWAGWLPDAGELFAVAIERRPDIVLLDVDMPGRDPFEAVAALAVECPDVRVVMLSGHVRNDLVNRAIVAGAWGYVAKGDGQRAMLEGITQVAQGEFAMSSEVRTCYAL